MRNYARNLVCSFKNFEELKQRYPNKKIFADVYCPNDEFCYIRPGLKGIFMIHMNDWSIWIPGEFPYFYKRIRK